EEHACREADEGADAEHEDRHRNRQCYHLTGSHMSRCVAAPLITTVLAVHAARRLHCPERSAPCRSSVPSAPGPRQRATATAASLGRRLIAGPTRPSPRGRRLIGPRVAGGDRTVKQRLSPPVA